MPLDFKKLLTARFLFTFAVQMQAVVLGWRIYELLKDPLYLGFIGLAEAIPAIGLALYAGYLVDRARPLLVYRRVMYVSLLSGVVVLAEHIFEIHFPLPVQVGLLYAAAFLTGLARSFSQPAIFATVPRLVERNMLMRATAMSSSAMQIARIAGPAFGGLIFGFMGAVTSSSIVCVLLFGGILAMLRIKKEIPAPDSRPHHASIRDEFLSGGRFVFKHPILFPALSLDMISVLFGGVTALLPIFASDILFVGPKGLGMLRAGPAIGATLMALYLSRSNQMRTGKWLLSSVAGFGFCILLFGISRNFYLSLFALALSGAFDSISMLIRSAAVQLTSPDHMRGKISAVNSIFIGSSNEIGELESGIAAKILGTAPAVYFGGIICLITVAAAAYLSPKLRNMDLNKLEATT
ncbi:MAG: MFS transporter [Bdellovibrionota bacterium]